MTRREKEVVGAVGVIAVGVLGVVLALFVASLTKTMVGETLKVDYSGYTERGLP